MNSTNKTKFIENDIIIKLKCQIIIDVNKKRKTKTLPNMKQSHNHQRQKPLRTIQFPATTEIKWKTGKHALMFIKPTHSLTIKISSQKEHYSLLFSFIHFICTMHLAFTQITYLNCFTFTLTSSLFPMFVICVGSLFC